MKYSATNFQPLQTCSIHRLFLSIILTKKRVVFQLCVPLEVMVSTPQNETGDYKKSSFLLVFWFLKCASDFYFNHTMDKKVSGFRKI